MAVTEYQNQPGKKKRHFIKVEKFSQETDSFNCCSGLQEQTPLVSAALTPSAAEAFRRAGLLSRTDAKRKF
jgi:hypothetical protein